MTQKSPFSSDDKRLLLSGPVNFRDLGGYRTRDNRRVKKGLVFRSDHLSRLTLDDHHTLQNLQFKVVCDFRTLREQQKNPDILPQDGSIRLLSLPVHADGFDPSTVMTRLQQGDDAWLTMDFFIDLYRRYLDDFGPVWGAVVRLISRRENLPLVFHCTGGKDRTGICAALLLAALGVPEESILADHDLSNSCNAERLQPIYARFAAIGISPDRAAPYLAAPAEPLVAMLEHLKKKYQSVDGYLLHKGGLDQTTLSALRSGLLQ